MGVRSIAAERDQQGDIGRKWAGDMGREMKRGWKMERERER